MRLSYPHDPGGMITRQKLRP